MNGNDLGKLDTFHPESVQSLIDTELPEVPAWIAPGVLPKRGILLFGGNAKIGKSFFAMEIGRSLVTGRNPFDCPFLSCPEKANVLLLDGELGKWTLKDRMSKTFASEPDKEAMSKRFFQISQPRGVRIDSSGHVDLIVRWIRECGANVLIIDPISKFHSYDENSNTEIARLFGKLEDIQDRCSDLDLSIILAHHTAKPPTMPGPDFNKFSPYVFRGAAKFFDSPDSLVVCNRIPKVKIGENGWIVETSWTLRSGISPLEEGTRFHVLENEDGRVIYKGSGKVLAKSLEAPVVTATSGFARAEAEPRNYRTQKKDGSRF